MVIFIFIYVYVYVYFLKKILKCENLIILNGNLLTVPFSFSEEKEVPESKPAGVYRPPGARLGTAKKGPTQGPPEIFNDTQFPSLLATAKHVETRK